MKTFRVATVDGRTVVEPHDAPVPEPGPGEIALDVKAAGLNRGEFIVGGVMHGKVGKPGGTEAAGIVRKVGDGVTGWRVGDRIMGRVFGHGAFAEATCMQDHQAIHMPDRLSFERAAAIPSSFMAAYDAVIAYGEIKSGTWMLVTAASSAAGVASILIARALGAHAIGTSGSPAKIERLKDAGMDEGIVTRKPDFAARVKEIAPEGMSLAVNCLGGSVFPECLKTLRHGGRLAVVGYVDGVREAPVDLRELHANRLVVFGISNGRLTAEGHARTAAGFRRDVMPLIEKGAITPLIDSIFPFDELAGAKDHMESDTQVGKIVVSMA